MFIIESLQISFISSKVSPSHPAFVAKTSSVFPIRSFLVIIKISQGCAIAHTFNLDLFF
mgnify:CR=1 FL=1